MHDDLKQHPCFIEDPDDNVALLLVDYESDALLGEEGALFVSQER